MQHLETERIASFDHDAPSLDELAHLEACGTCRAERSAFRVLSQQSLHLADTPLLPNAPSLTNWDSLSKALRAEGLIVGGTRERDDDAVAIDWTKRAKPRSRMDWWRVAAAMVIVALGSGVVGRITAGKTTGASSAQSSEIASAGVLGGFGGLGNTGYSSVDEATKALARTEREFDRISLWLTANDPSGKTSDILRRRLAALDQVVAISRAELQAAPQDRVLDHYYRSAYAAREATLQQLGGALPVGRTLERF